MIDKTKRERTLRRKRGEWITRGSATLIGGRVVFPGAASRTPDWHTKVLTVLSELDAAPASPCPDGEARRHYKVDGRADGGELELAPHLFHLAHGPGRAGVQSGANGRRGGGGTGQFRLPELRGSCRKEEPREDPRYGAPHKPGVYFCSLSLSTWTGLFTFFLSSRKVIYVYICTYIYILIYTHFSANIHVSYNQLDVGSDLPD